MEAADPDVGRGDAVVRALVTGDVLRLQQLVHPDVVDHSAAPEQPPGWAGLRERAMALCATYPDPEVEVDVLCVDGDTAMCRVHLPGILHGAAGRSPSGALLLVFVLRFRDGLLAEMWTSTDLDLPSAYRYQRVLGDLADDASVA
jgi:predicted ester cyclase